MIKEPNATIAMRAAEQLGRPERIAHVAPAVGDAVVEAAFDYNHLLDANDPTAQEQQIDTTQHLEEVRPGYFYESTQTEHLRDENSK